jgi:hypothetical protein
MALRLHRRFLAKVADDLKSVKGEKPWCSSPTARKPAVRSRRRNRKLRKAGVGTRVSIVASRWMISIAATFRRW